MGWHDVAADTGHKDSHGDLVVDDSGGVLTLIGGNVSDAVSRVQLPLSALSGVFAVLRKVNAPVGVV